MRAQLHSIAAAILILNSMIWSGAAAGSRPPVAGDARALGRWPQEGVIVVRLREGGAGVGNKTLGIHAADQLLARHGLDRIEPIRSTTRPPRKPGRIDLGHVYRVHYTGGTAPEIVARDLARLPQVVYAEPLYVHTLDVIPNDTHYPTQQVYYNKMRLPQAWDTTKGEQGSVVVAIVDGGTDWRHGDLLANVWTNPGETDGNLVDDDGNGFVDDMHGWNFANNSNDPTGLPATPNNAAHGTHTAGIACAVANNANGVAGASWNARLMPINVGSPTGDQAILAGYEGVLYAIENGADIINCSWGGQGSPTVFEQEICTYAREQGSVMVCAAGNNNSSGEHYPSAYEGVLGVATVSNLDVRVSSSNYGTWVDVSAQGSSILSTFPNNTYGSLTGTSMSSPHVAGICALVKTRYPGYTADQVRERVRVTSDNIDNVNPSRRGLLGYGRVNAEQALLKNTPAVRVSDFALTDGDGDGVVEPGEIVTVSVTVTNYLAACTGLTFKLRESSASATPGDSVATLASLDSLESAVLPPLTLTIAPGTPIQTRIACTLRVDAAAPVFGDQSRFTITVLPVSVTHDINRVVTSVTSLGKVGFTPTGPAGGPEGPGFSYAGGPNLLYEGSLMMGTSAARLANAARVAAPNSADGDDDFATVPGGSPTLSEPGVWAQEQTLATFNDSLSNTRLFVRLKQETFAYSYEPHQDYVVWRTWVRNTGAAALEGVRIGWFCDWDIDGGSFLTNRTGFDAGRNLGYIYDGGSGPDTYVGVQVLNAAGVTSYRGIDNDNAAPGNPGWGTYDGYTDVEKWESLSAGVVNPAVGPGDVSHAIATGPFDIAPGDSIEVGFAYLGGDDLPSLQAHADAAALKWQHLHSPTPVELYDLTATFESDGVWVRWRTGRETDVRGFRVHRALEGEALAALEPDLELETSHAYAFRDEIVTPGRYEYRIGEVGLDGSVTLHGSVTVAIAARAPAYTSFAPAVPNPFNPTTELRFELARAGAVTLDVYDARGRHVRTLLRTDRAEVGAHYVVWDGRDDAGRAVASGVYHARLVAPDARLVQRLTLLK